MAGLFARPTAAEVLAACAPYVGGSEVAAYVVGRSLNERLLYVVTERSVAVLRLGRLGLRPKALVETWPRGEVETEDGIASVRVGPYRAKVRLSDRRHAAEVARLAAVRG